MRIVNFTQTVLVLSAVALVASCRSTRSYPVYEERPVVVVQQPPPPQRLPPGQAKKIYGDRSARNHAPGPQRKFRSYPLIVISTPDIVIHRYNDGRYYYRNPAGWYYWRGYDNRYYLDERYIDRRSYSPNEYDDWYGKGKKKYKQKHSRKNKY